MTGTTEVSPEGLWRSSDDLVEVVGDRTMAWLLAVLVSEAEADFAEQNGPDALEELFGRHEIDITDLDRPSVV